MEVGNFAAAAKALSAAADLQEQLGDECGLASTLASMAEMELRRGEPDKAHAFATLSVKLSQKLRLLPYLTIGATLLSLVAAGRAEFSMAASWMATADRLTDEGAMMMTSREIIGRVLKVRDQLEAVLSPVAQSESRSAGTARANAWLLAGTNQVLDR
jgi:hypothetical protein